MVRMFSLTAIIAWLNRHFGRYARIRQTYPDFAKEVATRYRRAMPYVAQEVAAAHREHRLDDERHAWVALNECAHHLRGMEATPEKPDYDFSDFPWIMKLLDGIEPPRRN